MRKKNKNRETKRKKKLNKLIKITKKLMIQKRKVKTKKTDINSLFPYILLITFINHNIFVNLNDLRGQTKVWTNAGRNNLKGKNKISPLGLIELFRTFLKAIYVRKVRKLIIKFNGFAQHRYKIKKEIKKSLKQYRFKILAYETHIKIPFGGCKPKKKKRK